MTPPSTPLGAAVIDAHLAEQRARIAACNADGGHRWQLAVDDGQAIVDCARDCGATPGADLPMHMDPIPVTWRVVVEPGASNPSTWEPEICDEWIEVTPCG